MNSLLITADSSTYVRMVAVALLAATLLVWIGIAARLAGV